MPKRGKAEREIGEYGMDEVAAIDEHEVACRPMIVVQIFGERELRRTQTEIPVFERKAALLNGCEYPISKVFLREKGCYAAIESEQEQRAKPRTRLDRPRARTTTGGALPQELNLFRSKASDAPFSTPEMKFRRGFG
ncbi:MAG TPA: hypothetical protein VG843_00205, partial [Rhizomicrobium sp.]|nr:hypothetical protein [Rhizomicrobium sp.]